VGEDGKVAVSFSTKALADDFAKLDFYSRVLHSLTPDQNRIWRKGGRLDVEIKGWPKWMKWARVSEKEFRGSAAPDKTSILNTYVVALHQALTEVSIGTRGGASTPTYLFSIGKESLWTLYSFHSKGRTIAALCVLFDLAPHPRNDLELNVSEASGVQVWPPRTGSGVRRTYGDPSKTADALRNEGWPRSGTNAGIKVFREQVGGAQQQMYQLLRKEQHLESQVTRTIVQKRWKLELYESQNYTCQICHRKYPAEYLEPDHRIPAIVMTNGLMPDNIKDKLMTLCRYCNQVKREACKLLPPDYDWTTSHWAYPEKFELDKIKYEIETYAAAKRLSKKDVLKLLED
jgi:hypothetical protein